MNLTILNAGQNYYIRGGSDRYQFALSELLRDRGHQTIPFAAANPKNQPTQWSGYFPPGVNFDRPTPGDLMRFIYSKSAARSMERLLEENSINIAHLHIYYGQLTSSILAPLKKAGIPIVQTLHEYKIVCPVYTLLSNGEICQECQGNAFWKATVKKCNRNSLARSILSTVESYVSKWLGSVDRVDRFIAVSHFQREKLIELGVPAEKITAVHNFIDASEIEVNSEPGEYFLYFGRLESYKGLFTLIEAASSLQDIPLLIVGDGEARSQIEQLIEQKDLKHVKLLGFKQKEELHRLISNSICTISPSQWYETFGLTLIESFARGRPAIASSIGGMTEIVTDGVDGYLVSPGDAEKLRSRMVSMAKHRRQAVDMGLAGRRKVETQFNSENHYQKVMEVYQKLLSSRSKNIAKLQNI
ncbi:MAG: glycosyltransferase family 4 protein [Prochloraceae cyanobacterium]|nr:glycosyltransferase family 4 protein [Prochloraceae cyanobacterium]